MKKILLIFHFVLVVFGNSLAQSTIQGRVFDTSGTALPYTTVSILQPTDSTLAFFGITNDKGFFEIKNISRGEYLIQVALLNYKTYYKKIDLPLLSGSDLGLIILKERNIALSEVNITGERVPLIIKNDTVEYNAGSFKTKPDADVEELLKKMPGLEVDRQGNIKAQGEDVRKIYVDGKEFFGGDPKVASKNLPADAIDKVQVYNKKSDAAEFTGIDDGSREKSINLQLKENKKNGHFGDITVGLATDERYKLSAKLFKFGKKTQLAAIGMFNNINQAGFSLNDYMNFQGGFSNMFQGGDGLSIGDDLPLDMGQSNDGNITSGAAGLNYGYEYGKNKRFSASLMGTGSNKKLHQQSYTRNFINNGEFVTTGKQNTIDEEYMQRLNLTWRDDMDSSSQVTFKGGASLMQSNNWGNNTDTSAVNRTLENTIQNNGASYGSGLAVNATASWLTRFHSRFNNIKGAVDVDYKTQMQRSQWNNLTKFFNPQDAIYNDQFQNNHVKDIKYQGTVSGIYRLYNTLLLEPKIQAGVDERTLSRRQGTPPEEMNYVDSLSPDFLRTYRYIRPALGLKLNNKKQRFSVGVAYEQGMLLPKLSDSAFKPAKKYAYWLPSFMWQRDGRAGKMLNIFYTSKMNIPTAAQMLPVPNIVSPISVSRGNVDLRPEYIHSVQLDWMWFDQFSFTSLFAGITTTYTKDKINLSRKVDNNLAQQTLLINTPWEYSVRGHVEFSRPVRRIGMSTSITINEGYSKGINLINGSQNEITNFTHNVRLALGNRKKEKWSIDGGVAFSLTDARYSISSFMNNKYYNINGFMEINFRPNDHWFFQASCDVMHYAANSFDKAITIPLLKSELSYYFLKAKRGVFTLEGYDLLNQNKSIQRTSELNYLNETRSNILTRYVMLSFKYRLNRIGNAGPAIEIKTN